MTYIEYINQFWQTQANVEFSPNEAYLYFFLLHECNSRGWENPFECPNRKIVLSIGVSEPTMIDCRNRLQQKGLIQFEAGKKRAKSPVYYLNDLSKPLSKTFSKSLSKTFSKSLSSNKDLRLKNNNSDELFPPAPAREEKPKRVKPERVTPTLEQVKAFFEGRLADWEKQAEKFFYHFDSLGWKNANGVRIERWDSKANYWINEQLERNGNKIAKDDNGGAVTGAAGETGRKGTGNPFDLPAEELEDFINSIPIGQ